MKTELQQRAVEAMGKARQSFVIAVGDKSPFARCALEQFDTAIAAIRELADNEGEKK